MEQKDIVIVSGVRTPIARYGGAHEGIQIWGI